MGQKLGELITDIAGAGLGTEHLHIRGELRQELPAGAAGVHQFSLSA